VRAPHQLALRLVPPSPLADRLCKLAGRESGRVLGWGLRDAHTSEGTEGSRAGGVTAGNQISLCYPHRKQKQSTLGCGTHVGTQREPSPGSTRKVGEERRPARPNYFGEGTARGAARDKTTAPESSLRTRRPPVFKHPCGQARLQPASALQVSTSKRA